MAWPALHVGMVRDALPGDLDAIAAIENQCFSMDRISRSGLCRFLAQESASARPEDGILHRRSRTLVAGHGTVIRGYAIVLLRRNSRIARLYSIAVLPEHRRTGMARTLLAGAESVAMESGRNRMRLEVREDNAGAIRLYTSVGYQSF